MAYILSSHTHSVIWSTLQQLQPRDQNLFKSLDTVVLIELKKVRSSSRLIFGAVGTVREEEMEETVGERK